MTCAHMANKPAMRTALVLGPGICRTMPVGDHQSLSYNFNTYVPRVRALQKGRPPQEVYLFAPWVLKSEEALQIEMAWQMGLGAAETGL